MDATAYGAHACGAAHLSVQKLVDHPRVRLDLCVVPAEDRGKELNHRARVEDGHVARHLKILLVLLCECNAHEISTRELRGDGRGVGGSTAYAICADR